ncbi:hypothetical protein [Streptomyces variegatus]|uniref:hypothetical protein n=1 Tax=Streptomyces variegatus TaxID=284040 RepID=UPI003C2B4F5F
MCDPTIPPPRTPAVPADDRPAPWGHSTAAHRVFGACSHCRDYSVEEEVIQWRNRENKRHAAEEAALALSDARDHFLDLTSRSDRPCPGCGEETLTVVTVTLVLAPGAQGEQPTKRVVGGWAYCTACDATPHPTMEETDRG